MKIIKSASDFAVWRQTVLNSVGFIPTMGALHKGHLSLIKKSKELCDKTVVSIFINPTQFAPNEDLDSYPNSLDLDIAKLLSLSVDVLFLPTEQEMYRKVDSVHVSPSDLFRRLEGFSRPRFFYGVSTIVAKLFNVITPSCAFFGEKDAQQLRVIEELVVNMQYNVKLISCPTVRNKLGLALSSRNQYLSNEEKEDAANLYKGLLLIKKALKAGEKSPFALKDLFNKHIANFSNFRLDYVSIACSKTLKEVKKITSKELLVSCAAYYKDVRLIDNFTYQSST